MHMRIHMPHINMHAKLHILHMHAQFTHMNRMPMSSNSPARCGTAAARALRGAAMDVRALAHRRTAGPHPTVQVHQEQASSAAREVLPKR